MNDYWTGLFTGAGPIAVLFVLYLGVQIRLLRKRDRENAWLRARYEEAFTEALSASVAHDALLHVLRNRNDEGEEWKR